MLFTVATPANNERGPRYMEKALAAIHQSLRRGDAISFEYRSDSQHVGLYCRVPAALANLVTDSLIAGYPDCTVTQVDEQAHASDCRDWTAELTLVPEIFPILRHAQFEDLLNGRFADPITGILRTIKPDGNLRCGVSIRVRRASHARCRRALRAVKLLDREFFRAHHGAADYYARHITLPRRRWPAWLLGRFAARSDHPLRSPLDTSASRQHDREDDVQAAADKLGGHLFETDISLVVQAVADGEQESVERLRQMAGAFGAFTRSRLATFHVGNLCRGPYHPRRRQGFLLSHEELATLWHPPTATVQAERLQATLFTEREAPALIYSGKEEGAVPIAQIQFRNDSRRFGLGRDDRRRHLYVVGKTGMGKSTLLLNMVSADIEAGHGVCLVDPHGDLADTILRCIPRWRTNEVILFDVGDREHPIVFNPLECNDPSRIDQVTSGAVSAFKRLYDSWGPRLEDTLRNAVFATVEQGGTLLSLMQLLGDSAYREHAVPRIRDDIVRAFWTDEFAGWSKQYRTEAVAAIQNKVRPFLTNTQLRAIVSRTGKSLDLRSAMDAGRILVVNLSKGRIGEDNASLLGSLLVTCIQQAALSRADIPEAARRDVYLYVDEFQNLATSSFATILSEARKFRLNLILSHQYLKQIDEATANAVFGNIGSIVAFQVGSDDAALLSEQLSKFPGQVQVQDLTNLPRYTAYTRLLIDGLPSPPFCLRTLAPVLPTDAQSAEIVRSASRRSYARSVAA